MTSSKHLLSAIVVAAASLTAVAGAQAQSTTSGPTFYAPGSGYIGFNAGKSDFSVGGGNGLFSSEKKDNAYNIYGGTYFNPNGINLSLVGKLPLSQSFNLLGKVGTTYARTDVSSSAASGIPGGKESGFGLSYGVGAEYFFTPVVSGVVQYDEHNMKFAGTDKERVGAATVGLRYRF